MEDFMELALRRQGCRKFSDKTVEHEKLVRCVEAARLAPSACNSQPWGFVVVETPEKVAAVAKCAQQMGVNAFTDDAKAFFIVMEEHAVLMPMLRKIVDSQTYARQDLGGAVVYLCLEAESQGLGTCPIGLFDRETLCGILDIPKEKCITLMIAVGYPAEDKVRAKTRKPVEDIARFV